MRQWFLFYRIHRYFAIVFGVAFSMIALAYRVEYIYNGSVNVST